MGGLSMSECGCGTQSIPPSSGGIVHTVKIRGSANIEEGNWFIFYDIYVRFDDYIILLIYEVPF